MVVPKALKTKDSLLRSVSHNKIEKSLEALISPDNIQEPVLCNIPLDVPERVLAGWFIVNERWPNSKDAEEMRARGRFTIDPQAR